MQYLRDLPIDLIKIDGTFIQTIETDDRSLSIVEMICAMAKVLKAEVCAERVEHAEQRAILDRLGVEYAQGYLFGKPMPGAQTHP